VNAQSPNVRSGLALDPHDSQIACWIEFQKFAFVNGANAQLALDGGNEGRTLKEGARERFDGAVQFEEGFFQ
jgi:hypothetical protein